jgi:UDP-N-acetylglucosamine diphosphorylase/glucosamine-1-phosphate N-acetyltransferase
VSARHLYLFDDARARAWAPFSLTRPVGELLYGAQTLRARAERALGVRCEGHLCGEVLTGFDEPGSAPALAWEGLPNAGVRIVLSSRAALDLGTSLPELPAPSRIVVGGEAVGWVVPHGSPLPSETALADPASAPDETPAVDVSGEILGRPWDLMAGNAARLTLDFGTLWGNEAGQDPPGVYRVGDGALSLGEGAVVEPGVVLDLRAGPIRVDDGARVQGPARLTGPLYVGAGTVILGGRVGTSSIGPGSRIHGEVTDSVILGYANKAHDGHLGHAVLGAWVNLGAFTTNSDLKNNYGTVRVPTPDGEVNTGLIKVGAFLGDHVKTGIGTLLNTGSVVGAGSNLFGGLMPPTSVPPFSWGAGANLREYRLDQFLEVVEHAMERRGVHLTPGLRRVLTGAWHDTRPRRLV